MSGLQTKKVLLISKIFSVIIFSLFISIIQKKVGHPKDITYKTPRSADFNNSEKDLPEDSKTAKEVNSHSRPFKNPRKCKS